MLHTADFHYALIARPEYPSGYQRPSRSKQSSVRCGACMCAAQPPSMSCFTIYGQELGETAWLWLRVQSVGWMSQSGAELLTWRTCCSHSRVSW
jgi:hypothetical protein